MPSWAHARSWLPRTMWLTVCTTVRTVSSAQCSGKLHTPWKKSAFSRRWQRQRTRISALLSEKSNDVKLMLSLMFDIVTDVVSQAECPDSEFNFELFLKDQERMRSNTTKTGTTRNQFYRLPFLLFPARPVPGPRPISHTSGRYGRLISPMKKVYMRRLPLSQT